MGVTMAPRPTEISRVGVVWLIVLGALLGAIVAILATAPHVEAVRDAGPPTSSLARHCAPEAPWPCEPSR